MKFRPYAIAALCLVSTAASGCLIKVSHGEVRPIQTAAAPVPIKTPVKVHLKNGDIIVFDQGATVSALEVSGNGMRYNFKLAQTGPSGGISLDSVVAMESFSVVLDAGRTLALSALPTMLGGAVAFMGTALLAAAIFGSCPTIYVDSAGGEALQGESFSYSIAPLFEARDVDRLSAQRAADGRVWMRVRNEALETHYINHFELLQVEHLDGERVLPDHHGIPIVISGEHASIRARDAADRNVQPGLSRVDANLFSSDVGILADPAKHAYTDRIDLTFDGNRASDSVALTFRMRNSLLNTIMFYDVMLGTAGPAAVDWLGSDLETIGPATHLAMWYRDHSGMRVSVMQNGEYRIVDRLIDSGPIADKEVAMMLPSNGEKQLQVRIEFLADSWRIDRIALADNARRGVVRTLAPSTVTGVDGASDTAAVSRITAPDARYLTTYPGDWFKVGFDAPETRATSASQTRYTYLLAAQGFYTEWVRGEWLRPDANAAAFIPGNAALDSVYSRWRKERVPFEAAFYKHKVPAAGERKP